MIRNLKVLMAAAFALAAFGSFAVAAHATTFTAPGAGPEGVTTIVSEKDSANPTGGQTQGQTAHQVFDIRKADGTGVLSITCNEAFATNASATGEEASTVSSTIDFRGSSTNANCTFAGQSVTVNSGKCGFIFSAAGHVTIQNDGGTCAPGSSPIVFENPVLGCKVEVGAQTIEGVKYHNISVGGVGAVTLEANGLNLGYKASGVGCPYGETNNGLYTTGNAIIKGERGGSIVAVSWDA